MNTHYEREGAPAAGGAGPKDAAHADLLDGFITKDRYEAIYGSAGM